MKRILFALLMGLLPSMGCLATDTPQRVVVAYVTSWSGVMPHPTLMTHINYAFGHVNDSFDGVRIDNPERLRQIVALKKQAPQLRVLLSVGGWGSGRFSEMAADAKLRRAFARDCRRVVKDFDLDGIDIDWEYPTQSMAGISSSADDTEHFTLLMHDLRQALGQNRLLTIATVSHAKYIDFAKCIDKLDFVNVMSYDMAGPDRHHAALHPSPISGSITTHQAIERHLQNGVPAHKLVMGMPFYGRGEERFHGHRTGQPLPPGIVERWSNESQVPYLATEAEGRFVYGYDDARSLAIKCQYVIDHHLRGAMYWEYADDTPQLDYSRTLHRCLLQEGKAHEAKKRVLAIAEEGNEHEPFSLAAIQWMQQHEQELNIELTRRTHMRDVPPGELRKYHLILQLDYPPFGWNDEARQQLQHYIEHGTGAWIGFHHATLLGDIFGQGPMWEWCSHFLGNIRWRDYLPVPQDGTICIEDHSHPIMAHVPDTLRLPADEWYIYHSSPRPNVRVLAHVDEHSYPAPAGKRMGDHPVVWTNPAFSARNAYFQMGHSPLLFQHPGFCQMFGNAIRWALGKATEAEMGSLAAVSIQDKK